MEPCPTPSPPAYHAAEFVPLHGLFCQFGIWRGNA